MNLHDIAFCERRIAEEEMLADAAASIADAAAHAQLAMMYRAQLRLLTRLQPSMEIGRLEIPAVA